MRSASNPNLRRIAEQKAELAEGHTLAKLLVQRNEKPILASLNQVAVAANQVVKSVTFTADADADWQITGITASFVMANFPTNGIIQVKITDAASGYQLTQGYFPLHLLANPGYISATIIGQRFNPTKFEFTLLRSTSLQFDIISTSASDGATLDIGLEGKKVY